MPRRPHALFLLQVRMSDEKSSEDVKNDANIEIWKIKKLIKSLEAARGCAAALDPRTRLDSTVEKMWAAAAAVCLRDSTGLRSPRAVRV